jgi:hypothetical protein
MKVVVNSKTGDSVGPAPTELPANTVVDFYTRVGDRFTVELSSESEGIIVRLVRTETKDRDQMYVSPVTANIIEVK